MVVENINGLELKFETLPDLFSPKKLDNGTRLLIDTVRDIKPDYHRALDWGCGWGSLAIYLAKNQPDSDVLAIDSDIAATSTTTANAKLNGTDNLRVVISHGFDQIDKNTQFDLIVSNPPTHRGREVVEDMIAQSFDKLQKDGVILIVVEARLKPWVSKQLNKIFGDYKIVSRSNKHVVLSSAKVSQ
ncbi:MAG TPA: methyltransferase [Candidatus Saccharibacteria bacterium]|nr:methyltransferase [Candidatus Saccharibacteria bacterium]HMT39428.1 methyltransferase [Candidatus Saccharibacteria bacterium]